MGTEAVAAGGLGPEALWSMVSDAASSAGVGIVITIDDPAIGPRPVFVNAVVLDLLGYSHEEFIALPSLATVPPEEIPVLAARRARRLAGAPLGPRFETRMLAKDGRRIDIEVGVGRADWQGRPATVAFIRDLSPGREAMTRLVNLETIYEATIDGLLFVDRDLNLASANRRFAEIFGLSLDEVLHAPGETVRAKARARFRDPARFDAGLRLYEPERRSEVLDGDIELVGDPPRVVHEHSEPIFDSRGEYVGRVWTYRDVTHERELSRALSRSLESLEDQVQRRGAKLAEAAKLAALGQLIAGVAHELNNPLSFVKSNTEVIAEAWREALANPDVAAWAAGDEQHAETAIAWMRSSGVCDVILRTGPRLTEMNLKGLERITEIVRRLRESSAPRPAVKTANDLNAIVTETLRMLAPQIGPDVRLDVDLGSLPSVPCDAGRIVLVVTNLLVNAVQATEGKGRVSVRTFRDRTDAVLVVADDGKGISETDLPRIFDPFFTTKSGGIGLGLSMSYGIVQEHGGDISVSSPRGEGATFSVRLPMGARHAHE